MHPLLLLAHEAAKPYDSTLPPLTVAIWRGHSFFSLMKPGTRSPIMPASANMTEVASMKSRYRKVMRATLRAE